jgi:hypothetical protein
MGGEGTRVALLEPSQVAFVRARNNVIAGTRHAVFKVSPMRWDGDANALYTSSSGPLVEWLGTPYATLRTFHRATGQERTGLVSRPRSPVNTEGGDAPGAQGARRAHTGSMQPTSNAAPRDAAPAECNRTSGTRH